MFFIRWRAIGNGSPYVCRNDIEMLSWTRTLLFCDHGVSNAAPFPFAIPSNDYLFFPHIEDVSPCQQHKRILKGGASETA